VKISAKVAADSVSLEGKRLTTLEVEYPRFILSQLNTHRMLSKNSSSSRAIPIKRVIDMVESSPAMPIHWGKNQPGMQAHEEVASPEEAKELWLEAARGAVEVARKMDEQRVHKQVVNRILEPFQWMKTVITGTEWDNFFWLRDHKDGQPEIQELAQKIKEAMEESTPVPLTNVMWHTPYYGDGWWSPSMGPLEEAVMISMSCCAQVSYRRLDDNMDKAKHIYKMLNLGSEEEPSHASPVEHIAVPYSEGWEEGVTSEHKVLGKMSGNFAGWVQYRHLVKNNTVWG